MNGSKNINENKFKWGTRKQKLKGNKKTKRESSVHMKNAERDIQWSAKLCKKTAL